MDNSAVAVPSLTKSLIRETFAWMGIGLLVTAVTSFVVISSPGILSLLLINQLVFFGLLIVEFLVVVYLSAAITRISSSTALLAFLLYAVLNGVTLSLIFLVYTESSLFATFLATAATFGLMSGYGYVTDQDLTGVGKLSLMALFGLIIATVINIFLQNPAIEWVTTYAGILIFVGLTAYDTQKLKALSARSDISGEDSGKLAVQGALMLYLDFINLFLLILRIFGRRRK